MIIGPYVAQIAGFGMKKFFLWVGVILVVLLTLAYVNRDAVGFWLAQATLTPDHEFDASLAPAAPDYAEAGSWSALPGMEDGADVVPEGLADNQASAAADVFFVHPTTHFEKAGWNADLNHEDSKRFVEELVNPGQASAFNGCCKVYAPRYRQATLASFFPDSREGSGGQALDLAYDDLQRAFDYFLQHYNQGRPFILAGHSQGALHLKRLLAERISGTDLHARMIAAYPVGFNFKHEEIREAFPDINVCSTPDELGCMVTWNSMSPAANPFGDTSDDVCVNPLTWNGKAASHSDNPGAFSSNQGKLIPEAADASCENGRLLVSEIRTNAFDELPLSFGDGNYHLLDYALFYASIRDNAIARTLAFVNGR